VQWDTKERKENLEKRSQALYQVGSAGYPFLSGCGVGPSGWSDDIKFSGAAQLCRRFRQLCAQRPDTRKCVAGPCTYMCSEFNSKDNLLRFLRRCSTSNIGNLGLHRLRQSARKECLFGGLFDSILQTSASWNFRSLVTRGVTSTSLSVRCSKEDRICEASTPTTPPPRQQTSTSDYISSR
jgi:hypothetical protein